MLSKLVACTTVSAINVPSDEASNLSDVGIDIELESENGTFDGLLME
jgi:hypothetical protein